MPTGTPDTAAELTITVSDGAESPYITAAADSGYVARVAILCTKVALAVTKEDPAIDYHEDRKSRALQWIDFCSDPAKQKSMALLVASSLSLGTSATSGQIADFFAANWDSLSGVDTPAP